MPSPRIARLEDRIQVIVAQLLQTRVKDPRLGFVTVTDVRLTGDAREATVFYTVMGAEADLAATAAALESAKGLLRSAVGRRLGLRFVPTLAFVPDAPGRVEPPAAPHHLVGSETRRLVDDDQAAGAGRRRPAAHSAPPSAR